MNNHSTGKLGERLAVKHLKGLGYEILELNYRYKRYGELDIIALYGQLVCFVEVKTRQSDLYGIPSEAIDARKIQQIRKISNIYLLRNDISNTDIRFDVVEVYIDVNKKMAKVHLIENAF